MKSSGLSILEDGFEADSFHFPASERTDHYGFFSLLCLLGLEFRDRRCHTLNRLHFFVILGYIQIKQTQPNPCQCSFIMSSISIKSKNTVSKILKNDYNTLLDPKVTYPDVFVFKRQTIFSLL